MIYLTKRVIAPEYGVPTAGIVTFVLRVDVTIDNGDLFGPAIFVWQAKSLLSPDAGGDVCTAVASLAQMSSLPANIPTRSVLFSTGVPMYRQTFAEFHCVNEDEVADLWDKLLCDTQDLVDNYLASTAGLLAVETIAFSLSPS